MTHEAFKSWLDAYGRAWETRNPEAAAELFTADAIYQETPFVEPLRGGSAIFDYWSHVSRSQEQIRFGYEILAVTRDFGIAHWWASFIRTSERTPVKLDGIFLISLEADQRCKMLREWWVKAVASDERRAIESSGH